MPANAICSQTICRHSNDKARERHMKGYVAGVDIICIDLSWSRIDFKDVE